MPLDSPTNKSAETKSEKEIEDGLVHLPKLDNPDDVIEKYIKQLDCYKISDMTENQIKQMNVLLARKVAFCDATEKKTSYICHIKLMVSKLLKKHCRIAK